MGAVVAAAQELDVAELARGGGRGAGEIGARADRERLVERGGGLLVASAHRMDERGTERDERARLKRGVTGVAGIDDGAAQALQARVDGSRLDGGLPGFELSPGGCRALQGPGGGRRGGRLGRGGQRRAWLDPEFASEELGAAHDLARRGEPVARRGEAAHEQRLEVLVERVQLHEAGGEIRRCAGVARAQPRQRRLAKHGFRGRAEMAALRQQPDLEGRTRREAHAFEQLQFDAGHPHRLTPRSADQRLDIDERAGRERQPERVALHRRVAQKAAQGAEVPAQRRERIVRFAEQERDDLGSARGSIGAQQIGEQSPDLVSARDRARPPRRA